MGTAASDADFGTLLRRHRRAAGLTQEALAERAGLSARGISDLERGVRTAPQRETVSLLAAALGLSPAEAVVFAAAARHRSLGQAADPGLGPGTALPAPATPFVGREREVAQALALLRRDDVRLLTLTGTGGVGKTRLAQQVAAALSGDLRDGAVFVDLAPIRDPALVAAAVAHRLGVREAGREPLPERLAAHLRGRQALLMLDNFEQVVEAAPLVAELLAACPGVKALATSRERLRLRGEHEVVVPPLALPAAGELLSIAQLAQVEAVQLFVARAEEAQADFVLDEGNAAAVVAVCRRLDGLPLALELAAARSKMLAPAALLGRLERRLPLLTGGARDLPARLQTMRDAIAWSHDLLNDEEQGLFRRLAVFVGGWTLEAAEAVANDAGGPPIDVLDGISSLADHSLLRQVEQPDGGPDTRAPRFGMLETVREFALEQLEAAGEADAVRRRHAEYALALAERLGAGLTGPEQGRLLRELEREHDNVRAALAWAIGRDPVLGLRLARALAWFWRLRGHLTEGRAWMERALEAAGDVDLALRAEAWELLGMFAADIGDSALALRHFEDSLALWQQHGDPWGIAVARASLGQLAYERGDYAAARPDFEEALAAFRGLGDDRRVALSLLWLGWTTTHQGNLHEARRLLDESLEIFKAVAYQQRVARVHYCLGLVEEREGNDTAATARFQEALKLFREVGHQFGIADAALALACVALERGDVAAPASHLAEALRIMHEMDSWWGMAEALEGCAALAAARGRSDLALCWAGAASALRAPSAYAIDPFAQTRLARRLDQARRTLGRDAAAAAWSAGMEADRHEVVASVMAFLSEPAPGPASAAPGAPSDSSSRHGLSAREVEVVRLVAAGRTDQQIADALFIARRTVEWHVRNVLGKLGAANRAEAAAFAARHGLV